MQSGVTGINALRIYNPVKQGLEHDPQGRFTRRWLPELAGVPDEYLHEPWRWPGAGQLLGRAYPEPVIDPAAALRAARAAMARARAAPGFREAAERVAARHGSRQKTRGKARQGVARGAAPAQLSLDLRGEG